MLRILTGISLFFFTLASLNARPLVRYRQVSLTRQTSTDEWKSGTFDTLEGLTVRRIEFEGVPNTPDRVVRRAFWIKEGDVFSRRRLAQSLKSLNRLGLFERVTEANISWRKYGDIVPSDQVDLLVSVKEKRRK